MARPNLAASCDSARSIFLTHRASEDINALINGLLGHEFVQHHIRLASRRLPADARRDDAVGLAVRRLGRRFERTRGHDYRDDGVECFGRYVACLTARYVCWAYRELARNRSPAANLGGAPDPDAVSASFIELDEWLSAEDTILMVSSVLVPAIQKLPPRQREVLLAWMWDEDAKTTAARLGVKKQAISNARTKGLKRLKTLIAQQER